GHVADMDARHVARVAAGLGDRASLLWVAARQRHLVLPVHEQASERRPPRTSAHHDRPHAPGLLRVITLRASHEIDRDGNPLQVEPLRETVLDPVAEVARDETRVVDEDAEPWGPGARLGHIEQVEALAVPRRRLP